jgi:hypothetical protein
MTPLRDLIAQAPGAFARDVMGAGAIALLFAVALHLPALL